MDWMHWWPAVLPSLVAAIACISGTGPGAAEVRVERPGTRTIEVMRRLDPYDVLIPNQVIHLTGPIGTEDVDAIKRALAGMPRQTEYREDREVHVQLDSPGGSFAAGIEIARVLDRLKVPTFVPAGAECLSACAVVFMAGTEQFMGGEGQERRAREVEIPMRLGFHRPFMADFAAAISPAVIEALNPAELQELFVEEYLLAFDTANELIQEMLDVDPGAWNTNLLLRMLTATRSVGNSAFVYLDTVNDALEWEIDVVNVIQPSVAERSERFDTAMALCFNYGHRADTGAEGFWPPIDRYDQEYSYNADPGPQGAHGDTFSADGREVSILWYHEGLIGCTVRFSESGAEVTVSAGQFGPDDPTRTFRFATNMGDRLWGHDPRTPLDQLALAPPPMAAPDGRCLVLEGRQVIDDEPCRRQGEFARNRESVDTFVWPSGSRTVIQRQGASWQINGRRAQVVDTMPAGMSLCLRNEETERVFCFAAR